MARTKTRRVAKVLSEMDQFLATHGEAKQTDEQRAAFEYELIETVNPYANDEPGKPTRAKAVRKVAPHTFLWRKGSIDAPTHFVMETYSEKWALSGLSYSRCALNREVGGGKGECSLSQQKAIDWITKADAAMPDAYRSAWMAVVRDGQSVLEYAGPASRGRNRAVQELKSGARALRQKMGLTAGQ